MKKKKRKSDPHREREASKYERPIVSREYILQFLSEQPGPVKMKELAVALELEDSQDREALRRRLRAMERDGQVVKNRRGGYGVADKMDIKKGRVSAHRDGFGFFIPEDGSQDMFLSPRQMCKVMHGDTVLARLAGQDRRGRLEAKIVEVLDHCTSQVVGRYYFEGGVGFVEPSDQRMQRVIVPEKADAGAQQGQIVTVKIVEQPNSHYQPIGEVVEILGDHMSPGMEIEVAVRAYALPHEWPDQVVLEAGKFGDRVADKLAKGREDLRDTPLLTIDGEDAKDFDDAVFAEKVGNRWRLVVAIADVSHYVKPDSALDQEARLRGNSVYFPGRVIPMLPNVLSNGLCSLNPQVDRLCLCCEMMIDQAGNTQEYRFFSAIMSSHARLTYTEVGAALDGDPGMRNSLGDLWPRIECLHAMFKAMRKQRAKRGAIDFESVETRIVFGPEKKIEQIVPVVRNDAHCLIEECMVAANVAAAKFLLDHDCPGLYRNHEGPPPDALEDLRSFLAEFGLKLGGGGKPEAGHFAQLLDKVRDRPDARLIQTVLLRSMSQAVYGSDNVGHFGLAFKAYTHFTSPIRRYPDLLVHRAIYHLLQHGSAEAFIYSVGDLQLAGQQCSATERRADEATRDAVNWLKCEYMLGKVNMQYAGIIVSVTNFGLFVELDDIFVEGLVHVTDLVNDYYQFDPIGHQLTGERSGKTYRIGDKIEVVVARVNLDDRKIDFLVAEKPATAHAKRRRKPKPKSKH